MDLVLPIGSMMSFHFIISQHQLQILSTNYKSFSSGPAQSISGIFEFFDLNVLVLADGNERAAQI